MKYFFDTEFIEGFHKPLFGKRRHFIDLISIGIVCEDGREFYAISTDFNPKNASEWVKKNVIAKLPQRHFDQSDSPRVRREAMQWMPNEIITREILDFFHCDIVDDGGNAGWLAPKGIEIYAYYADYDWVLFCSLFGRMIDLPGNFPMYCRDLKQMMDERGLDKGWKHKFCPDPEGAHDALVDAKWNMKLFNAIKESADVKVDYNF